MTLSEGESTQLAEAAHEWELAAWTLADGKRQVHAVDIAEVRSGSPWNVPSLGLELTVSRFFPNCRTAEHAAPGVTILNEVQAAVDPADNIPGAIVSR